MTWTPLATALYVRTDDLLVAAPDLAPWRPKVGIKPRLTDAELVTLAVMQALLGFTSEARWLRHARAHLGHLFRYLPLLSATAICHCYLPLLSATAARLQRAAAPGFSPDPLGDQDSGHRHHVVDR
jgi:hypothetical protein